MKISELIEKLTAAIQDHGDIDVMMYDYCADTSVYTDGLRDIVEVEYIKERPYWFEGNNCIPTGITYGCGHILEIK